jgi:hypothetical protein
MTGSKKDTKIASDKQSGLQKTHEPERTPNVGQTNCGAHPTGRWGSPIPSVTIAELVLSMV